MNNPIRHTSWLAAVACCALAVVGLPTACGQQPEQSEIVDEAAPEQTIRVFRLQKVQVDEAVAVLQSLISQDTRVVADQRTNSVIMSSDSEKQFELVEQLLTMLDNTAVTGDGVGTRLMRFEIRESPGTQEIIQGLGGDILQAVDFDRQILVLRGEKARIDEFADSLVELERIANATGSQQSEPVLLRVAWLMNRMEESQTRPIPDSMQEAVQTLNQVGIQDLRLVTQLLVVVEGSHGPFESEGLLQLPEGVRISVQGVRNRDGAMELQLQTSQVVTRRAGRGNADEPPATPIFESRLQATVSLHSGQLAVLGATPCGPHDSVFVVEVLPQP